MDTVELGFGGRTEFAEKRRKENDLNHVQIIGYLGRNAEMKFTPNGTPVTKLSIATKESFKKDGEFQQRTERHRVRVFGDLACDAERCRKGQKVDVIGRFSRCTLIATAS